MDTIKSKTVGDVAAFFFIGYAAILSAIDFFLFVFDAVPVVGIPISFVASDIITFLAVLTIYLPLYMIGAYRGAGGAANSQITLLAGGVGIVPVLNDFPIILGTTIYVIVRSRLNDKIEQTNAAAKKAAQAKQEEMREQLEINARAAQQRAEMVREQALAASIQAANDNSSQLKRAA